MVAIFTNRAQVHPMVRINREVSIIFEGELEVTLEEEVLQVTLEEEVLQVTLQEEELQVTLEEEVLQVTIIT